MCDNFKHVALTRGIKKCIIKRMRYAVITDVHSNIFALRAALFEIDKLHADKIICLGDIVGNGFYPDETVSLIRERGDIECVKGNHDLSPISTFRTIRGTIRALKCSVGRGVF